MAAIPSKDFYEFSILQNTPAASKSNFKLYSALCEYIYYLLYKVVRYPFEPKNPFQ